MTTADEITFGLELAEKFGPSLITFIKQVRQKDGTVATSVTVLSKVDEADANYKDNIAADTNWFLSHGLAADGGPLLPQTAPSVPVIVPKL